MALEQGVLRIFQEAWTSLKSHPILCLPTFIAWLAILLIGAGVMGIGLAGSEMMPLSFEFSSLRMMGTLMGWMMILMLIALILTLMAHGVTVVMAREAIETRTVELLTALKIFRQRLAHLFLAGVLVGVLVLIGTLFLFIPGLIAAFLLMFTIPGVMLDRLDAANALTRSFNIIRHHLSKATLLFIGFIVLIVLWAILSMILGVVPILGSLINLLLGSLMVSYISLVLVKFYLEV